MCDLETSRMGAPYIYDISRLRVKFLVVKFLVVCFQWIVSFLSYLASNFDIAAVQSLDSTASLNFSTFR